MRVWQPIQPQCEPCRVPINRRYNPVSVLSWPSAVHIPRMANSSMNEIPNDRLRAADVPPCDASWSDIAPFALTFDGYAWSEDCGEIANGIEREYRERGSFRENLTLDELRACLFFDQRAWRHFGEAPNADALDYIHALLNAIRSHVTPGN